MHGAGGDPEGLPRQRRGTTPQMHGRYPDFDVLEQADHWDEVTRRVVLARLEPPPLRFFDEAEARTLGAFCDTVLAQDREPRVPVLPFVDAKLFEGRLDGFQYADMPGDRETWRLVARGLDEAAREHGAPSYGDADADAQLGICEAFAEARLSGGVWDELPVAHALAVGCARCSVPSTRIPGRGTRSASAAPRTRAATCASPSARRSRGKARTSSPSTPCPT